MRYYLPEDITCVARFQSRVPFFVGAVEQTSLTFPLVLDATGELYGNRAQLVAGLNAALPEGVTAAMHADGVSVVVTHESTYTPPDSFALWPRTTIYVVDQTAQPLCPFIGPVTGPAGGTFTSLLQLVEAIDAADDQAFYRTTTAADCGILVIYDPDRAAPGNITVNPNALESTLTIVEQGSGTPVPCPLQWPIYMTDGAEVSSIGALAFVIQSELGAAYGVVPNADGCTFRVTYGRNTAEPPATFEVLATRTKVIPVRLNGQTVCPPPFPVALASDPNGAQYSSMAALADAWKATLPAGWDADPTNTCQILVRYPMSATTVPTGVDVVTQATVTQATFQTVRSKQSDLAVDFTSAMPSGNTHYGSDLLDPTKSWPRRGVFNYSGSYAAVAYLYGLLQSNGQAPSGRVYKLRITIAAQSQTYVGLRLGPNGADPFMTPSSRGGAPAATRAGYNAAITDIPSGTFTVEWELPENVNPANLCLIVQMPANDQQIVLADIEYDTGGTGGGGSGTGGTTTPSISTIAAQTVGVGTALAVNFTVANNPTSVVSSVGSVSALGAGSYRFQWTPTAAGTTTVTIQATNGSGTATRTFSVTASTTTGGGGGSTATSVKQQLKDDMRLPHVGNLDGVPDFYDWAHNPRVGMGNDGAASSGFNAATAWGQIYSSYGGSNDPAPNTFVQVANLGLAVLSKSGTWSIIQRTILEGDRGIDAGYFTSDFQGNVTSPEDPPQLADGTRIGHPNIKYNLHFFPQGRVPINNNDIAGIIAWFDARLVLRNASGPDDRANARYLAGAGGDYWATLDSPWPSNGDFAIGRHRFVTNDWQTFTAHTLTDAQIDANPPPIPNFKITGQTTTPPTSSSWTTPTGRAIRVMPVGDSITGFMGESSAGYTTLANRLSPTQVVSVGGQTGFNGVKHNGIGAWCVDDTNGRCTHTNGYHAGGVIQNIASWLASYTPDVVVLNIGTNDRFVVDDWNDNQIAAGIGQVIDLVRQNRPSCWVLVTGLRYLDEVGGYSGNANLNNLIQTTVNQKAAAGAFCSYFDQYAQVNNACDFRDCSDYVHPSDQGVAKMMNATEAALEALFAAH
jgi:lysophospholipase L1-like esterase